MVSGCYFLLNSVVIFGVITCSLVFGFDYVCIYLCLTLFYCV